MESCRTSTRRRWVVLARCACVVALLASGSLLATGGGLRANVVRGCVERFDASVDYFPEKAVFEDAANVTVSYRRSYKIVALNTGGAGGIRERYVLVQCGTPVPELTGELAGAQVVTVPARSLFALWPAHYAPLVDLDRVDVLTGVGQLSAVTSPEIRARSDAGRVVEFARIVSAIDVERVVSARPSLVMAGETSSASFTAIRGAGVPVVANADWQERTALGRAEWMKYTALFLNEERTATARYGAVKARYREASARARARSLAAAPPLVMTGRSTRGMFVIAGGRSYVAALIEDAGGRYVWADNTATGSVTVDLEAQVRRAANADIWINGGGWADVAAMLDDEPRYAEFKAFRQRQVWVYERRLTADGANDYWSRGVARPDLILADLVRIFHPTLSPDHVFEWYMPVPERKR